jgi:hypothetical protein
MLKFQNLYFKSLDYILWVFMRQTRYVYGHDFLWLIDVENSHNVSEPSTPKFFHGSKPHSWVPSVRRVISLFFAGTLGLVLLLWWVKTCAGWGYQLWSEAGRHHSQDLGETILGIIACFIMLFLLLSFGMMFGIMIFYAVLWLLSPLYNSNFTYVDF